MKVTVDIDCTPEEARQFFGLPDVVPMQKAVLAEMEKRTLAEMEKFTPENMLATWFSTGQQGADLLTKLLSTMRADPAKRKRELMPCGDSLRRWRARSGDAGRRRGRRRWRPATAWWPARNISPAKPASR